MVMDGGNGDGAGDVSVTPTANHLSFEREKNMYKTLRTKHIDSE